MSFFNLDNPSFKPQSSASSSFPKYRKPSATEVITLDFVLWFGRYAGFTIKQIIDKDHKYLLWCCDNVAAFQNLDKKALNAIVEASDADDIRRYGDVEPDWSTYND